MYSRATTSRSDCKDTLFYNIFAILYTFPLSIIVIDENWRPSADFSALRTITGANVTWSAPTNFKVRF